MYMIFVFPKRKNLYYMCVPIFVYSNFALALHAGLPWRNLIITVRTQIVFVLVFPGTVYAFLYVIKGGRSGKKFRKSKIRKFSDQSNLLH
jgi:hypothetical protein